MAVTTNEFSYARFDELPNLFEQIVQDATNNIRGYQPLDDGGVKYDLSLFTMADCKFSMRLSPPLRLKYAINDTTPILYVHPSVSFTVAGEAYKENVADLLKVGDILRLKGERLTVEEVNKDGKIRVTDSVGDGSGDRVPVAPTTAADHVADEDITVLRVNERTETVLGSAVFDFKVDADGDTSLLTVFWQDGDLETIGAFEVEMELVDAGGSSVTIPRPGQNKLYVKVGLDIENN